eukprot:g10271.t1
MLLKEELGKDHPKLVAWTDVDSPCRNKIQSIYEEDTNALRCKGRIKATKLWQNFVEKRGREQRAGSLLPENTNPKQMRLDGSMTNFLKWADVAMMQDDIPSKRWRTKVIKVMSYAVDSDPDASMNAFKKLVIRYYDKWGDSKSKAAVNRLAYLLLSRIAKRSGLTLADFVTGYD